MSFDSIFFLLFDIVIYNSIEIFFNRLDLLLFDGVIHKSSMMPPPNKVLEVHTKSFEY